MYRSHRLPRSELAEHQEKETEAEYEAWRLLLDQMKEADAAQAGNLGQALGPAIARQFQELTQRRYQSVQLTAQLATEGVLVSGAVRSAAQLSVGTREQLSTLYRLSLAEYLQTVIVLDFVNRAGPSGASLARLVTDQVAVELANSEVQFPGCFTAK